MCHVFKSWSTSCLITAAYLNFPLKSYYMKKSNEQQAARDLFFQTDHSQAEIARQVGVDPKTVNLWVKHGKWKEIKQVARRTPATLVEQYFNQLAELNNTIEARPEGERFASLKEAETMRKLLVCINNIQKQTSLGASIDIMQNFISRIDRRDHELALKLIPHGDEYLKSRDYNGIRSYEIAYDTGEDSNSTLKEERSVAMDIDADQRNAEAPAEQSLTEDPQAEHRQYIGNEQELNGHENMSPAPLEKDGMRQTQYPPKCTRDPDDPYTFYYNKITRRKFGSPKYGLPPDGFREVPKKDPVDKRDIRGAGRYNWL